jgi:carbon monoxide dehydrogenase subunit G
MELTQTSTVPVPVETAWKALDDPERIAPCMPGASLESVDGDSFTGNVKIEPRPIGLSHRGTARFVDADPETRTVIIEGSGKDAKGNGSASATVTARLTEDAGNLATLLTSDEDAPAAAPSTPTQAVAATAAPVAARPAVTARPPPSSTRSPCWASRRRSAVGWPPPWFSLTSSSWAGPSAGSATAADPHRGAPVHRHHGQPRHRHNPGHLSGLGRRRRAVPPGRRRTGSAAVGRHPAGTTRRDHPRGRRPAA